MDNADDRMWDVAIVGGGAAGLSAALTLARARRKVIVIDAGRPRNAPAQAAHGLLGLEGINPLELLAKGRDEVTAYGGHLVRAEAAAAAALPSGGFSVEVSDGSRLRAGQIVVATGVHDEIPAISGAAERWGRDVVHCPYCHGWEIRDQRIGLIATGPMSAMQALLFHQWSDRMWSLPNGIEFPDDQLEQLVGVGITVVPGPVAAVEVTEDRLSGIRLRNGSRIDLDTVALPTLTRARLDGLTDLDLTVQTDAAGVTVVADADGRTSAPGVWAAGNVANPGMQVSESAANGTRVAMTINTELVFTRAEHAVAEARPKAAAQGSRR